jgi:hypothetical protein
LVHLLQHSSNCFFILEKSQQHMPLNAGSLSHLLEVWGSTVMVVHGGRRQIMNEQQQSSWGAVNSH